MGFSGKLKKKHVAKSCLKTMPGALLCFFFANHWMLIGDVQAERQHPRASVAVKYQVLIGLDLQHRQLVRSTQANDSVESASAQLDDTYLEANPLQGGVRAESQ